ncbi:Uncharacterised protein [Mycobacteroides abscessus subsp. abscessus]|nr:Uncharacterised protein [Mycobacteroides abscessus subsp. abscessus]
MKATPNTAKEASRPVMPDWCGKNSEGNTSTAAVA